jgi:hypothetical protein
MTRRISTTIVPYARQYTQFLSSDVEIGQLASYFSQTEANVDSYTLEIGIPIKLNKYIGDINIESGDRLLIFLGKPSHGNLPPPLREGDKILRFRSQSGDISLHSQGKHQLMIGIPDRDHQFMPDVDLRYFIPHRYLNHISSGVLNLQFDPNTEQWVANRIGETRVRIHQLDLMDQNYPLQEKQVIQFYADDTSFNQLLGQITIEVETVHSESDWVQIQSGNEQTIIRIGLENGKQLLNISDNIRITQIINGLARHNRLMLGDYIQAFIMRLIAPDQTLDVLQHYPNSFLYVPTIDTYSPNVLRLTDVHDKSRIYTLYVGQDDEDKSLGFHLGQENIPLDVDLSSAFMRQGHDPRQFDTDSPYQAQLLYRADENSWWVHLDADACMPVFLNNERLTLNPMPLKVDDVISLGPSINNSYVRLVVSVGET